MFDDTEGHPCHTCRTVHEPYADEICAIETGAPSRHGYEMWVFNECACPICVAGCHVVRNRARR